MCAFKLPCQLCEQLMFEFAAIPLQCTQTAAVSNAQSLTYPDCCSQQCSESYLPRLLQSAMLRVLLELLMNLQLSLAGRASHTVRSSLSMRFGAVPMPPSLLPFQGLV